MKRILVVSCTHGNHLDKESAKAVLKFKREYKPHATVHLGDMIDLSAFMGSNVKSGEGEPIEPDLEEGIRFVEELQPTTLFMGNHEERLWRLLESNNEMVSWAAGKVIEKIEYLARKLKAELVPYAGTFAKESWRRYGNTAFGHGFLFNINACRDHAEMLGMPVVHGHIHKLVQQPGRIIGAPQGTSVGCLCSIPAMSYAKTRRETSAWENGFGWGEYDDNRCIINLTRTREWQRPEIQQGN